MRKAKMKSVRLVDFSLLPFFLGFTIVFFSIQPALSASDDARSHGRALWLGVHPMTTGTGPARGMLGACLLRRCSD